MSSNIRDAAINLGYLEVRPVTGHPFEHWRSCLDSLPLGQNMSFEHDPVRASGWQLEEITVWVAIASTPPMANWPEGCGEIGAYYMRSEEQVKRRVAWENAVIAMGYELVQNVTLPERAAAIRAGLGVHGLNGLLVTPDYGSFVNITVLLVHNPPPPEARGFEHDLYISCGNCGKCIQACPTGAISNNGFNSLICLRDYINHPDRMREDDYAKMGRRIQGCDSCQKVCPKNSSLACDQPPNTMIECVKLEKLLTEPDIKLMSQAINLWYLPENRIKSQAILAAANTGRKDLLHIIEAYIGSDDKSLDKMARWAAKRLRNLQKPITDNNWYDRIIKLDREKWQGHEFPFNYVSHYFYDVKISNSGNDFQITFVKRPFGVPYVNAPNDKDKLFQPWWDGVKAWGIIENERMNMGIFLDNGEEQH